MESKPEIFFSYAWSDDTDVANSREKIVDDLYESLRTDGFNVVRDKNDLRYKGLISDLTGRIGRGKFIVVAISDKYLKSTYCMSELLEIYRRSNSDIKELLTKIYPIVLGDAKIYKPEDRIDYLKFWEAKKEELTAELKEVELENAAPFAEDLRMYDEISSVIPVLSNLLKDINTLNPQKLSENNFADIKSAIVKAASSLPPQPEVSTVPASHSWFKFPGWLAIIAGVVITGILFLFLHFVHVSTTQIKMELTASEINFRLPRQQVVTNIMRLSSIGATGLENVQVPAPLGVATSSEGNSTTAVLLSVDTASGRAGSLSLDAIALVGGNRTGIRHTDISGEYRFSLLGKAPALPVQVNGLVRVNLPPNPPQDFNFTSPGIVNLQPGKDGVDLDLNFLPNSNRIFPGVLDIDSFSVSRIDQNFDTETPVVRAVSTILDGAIYYESLGSKTQVLSRGEHIRFKNSEGKLSKSELLDGHISLTFIGNVSGMTTGDDKKRASLMPSLLEWLKARISIPLLLGALLVTFVLIFGVRGKGKGER